MTDPFAAAFDAKTGGAVVDDGAFAAALDRRFAPPPPPHGRPGPLGPIKGDLGPGADRFLAAELGQQRLGDAGFTNMGIRADLGFSDTFEEKRLKFQSYFPQGDFRLIEVPPDVPAAEAGRGVIMYRPGPDQPWSRFDAPGIPSLAEFGGDLADLSGVAPQAIGEGAIAIGTGGMSLPAQTLRIAGGGMVGEAIRIASERARGIKTEPLTSDLGRLGVAGLTSGLGQLATVPLSGAINIIRGAGALTARPGAAEAIAAEQMLGLPPLIAAQLTDNPLLRRMAQQSSALTPLIPRVLAGQQEGAKAVIPKMFSPAELQGLAADIGKLEESTRAGLLNAVAAAPTSKEAAGQALQAGIKEWNDIARAEVNTLYSAARLIETPTFDLAAAKAKVAEVRAAIQAGVYDQASPSFDRLLSEIENLPEFLTDQTINGQTFTSIDRLNGLLGRAYDNKVLGIGQLRPTQEQRQANQLYSILRGSHDTPVNKAPGFDEAWGRAKTAASRRFDTIERIEALSLATQREFAPYALAQQFMTPGSHDVIKLVKTTLNARGLGHRWEPIKQAFRNSILEDAVNGGSTAITRRLDEFDPETMNLLLTKAEQVDLRSIATKLGELEKTGLEQALKSQTANADTVIKLVTQNNSQAIGFLLDNATPTQRSALRAGILDWLGTRLHVKGTQEVMDRRGLYEAVSNLRKTGAINFLEKGDIDNLVGLETYLRFVTETIDPGSSIVAGSVVQGMAQLSSDAVIKVMHMVGIGRFLASGYARKLLTGQAKERLRFTPLKVAGSILADVQQQIQQEKLATYPSQAGR